MICTASGVGRTSPLQDPDADYREVQKLDGMRDELSAGLLGQALESSNSQQARLYSLHLLDELDTAPARQRLLSALGDSDENVRVAAVSVLSKWQNEEALYTLAQVFYGDASPAVRVAALQSLARLKEEYQPAARSFLESAVGDPDQSVARAASTLINNMGKR
ncbi:MAG: HEAT repeat domain-containing protein [Gammaproteobacteria bacterium]|nr:HEAT repeat domain-containing protein [Gammaproteobacteria bacterium]